ncbi:ShlB/FhaC/HecB family hemolysin secretion/activation protein [Orbus wheelerorum]
MKNIIIKPLFWLCCLTTLSFDSISAPLPTLAEKAISDQQLIYQQERQKALQGSLASPQPDIRLLKARVKTNTINFPAETPCFVINHVELRERDSLPFIMPLYPLSNQAIGRCLGGEGIGLLMSELQNRIISYGYITTRVVAPEQDLTSGTLVLLLVKGTVRDVYYADGSDKHNSLQSTLPVNKGQLLNLRDIEQGLENLQRIPTVKADMQLVPGENPGESDIVINRTQSKYWRIGASLDDSGTKDTGRYQGGLTLYLDNPLGMSDAFYVSGGHDLDGNSKYGSKNYLFSYSVPMGYWALSSSLSSNTYNQTVAGTPDYQYSGRSRNINVQLSRVIHRNESQKTTLSYGLNFKESHNYINDTEVEVQGRKTTSWILGINHRHYFGNITLDAGASYKKGVRWFGAHQAPEEGTGYGTALSDIFNVNVSLNVPFTLAEQSFRYNFDYQGQFTRGGDLTPPERFSIGSRWTVRGFDGELSLSADSGWYIRNELALATPFNNELYLGLDYGEVSGANSGYLLGKKLAGSALGLRGSLYGVSYDAFMGTPLYKPHGFKTDDVTLGFNINWSY